MNHFLRLFRFISLALSFVYASPTLAHGNFIPMQGTHLNADIMVSAQDKDSSELSPWQIPGVLMGGEAHASEQGIYLFETRVSAIVSNENGVFGLLELGTHGHHGDMDPEIEQAVLGQHWTNTQGHIKLEAGKMKALFSLENPLHPSERSVSEAPLPYLALFGGHYTDTGARAQSQWWHGATGLSTFGLEVWDGNRFPGGEENEDLAYDVFARYRHQDGNWTIALGASHFRSQAKSRRDTRQEDGHGHSGSTTNDSPWFSGDIDTSGLHFELNWQSNEDLSYRLFGEAFWSRQDGELRDETRLASLSSRYMGRYLQGELKWRQHMFAIRASELVLENHLKGSGSAVLADEANLITMEDKPFKITAAYTYGSRDSWRIRAELIHDQSTSIESNAVRLSALWSYQAAYH